MVKYARDPDEKIMQGASNRQQDLAHAVRRHYVCSSISQKHNFCLPIAFSAGPRFRPACALQEHTRVRNGSEEDGVGQGKEVP